MSNQRGFRRDSEVDTEPAAFLGFQCWVYMGSDLGQLLRLENPEKLPLLQSSPDKVMIVESDVWFCKFVFLCPKGHGTRRVALGVELSLP